MIFTFVFSSSYSAEDSSIRRARFLGSLVFFFSVFVQQHLQIFILLLATFASSQIKICMVLSDYILVLKEEIRKFKYPSLMPTVDDTEWQPC